MKHFMCNTVYLPYKCSNKYCKSRNMIYEVWTEKDLKL